ncbi:MAG: RNA polymerase sigma factor [Coraliomargaritaceae bacterium]
MVHKITLPNPGQCLFPQQSHATVRMNPTASSSPDIKSVVEDIDSLCLRSVANGDQDVFAGLVERWQSHLINYFYRSTGNRDDAEDLAQETFLDLYRAAQRYEPRNNFKAFLFTLARRRLIDGYRKKARRPLQYIDPAEPLLQQHADRSDSCSEIEEAFHRALADLPVNQRQAILLLQQQSLSYEEIAEALGGSVSAVKSWIHRARAHLRQALAELKR